MASRFDQEQGLLRELMDGEAAAGGVSLQEVQRAEEELGVRFPEDFRYFLREYGSASFRGYEIWGLTQSSVTREPSSGPPLWSDVLRETSLVRRAAGENISRSMIPVSSDGTDFRFYLDVKSSDEDRSTFRVLGPGKDGDIVGESLIDFLRTLDADSW